MEEHIRTSDSHSIPSSNLGRVMNTLLTARPKKLEDAISRVTSGSPKAAGSLEEPLFFLSNYINDAAAKGEMLDQILVPMIENLLKSKDSRRCNQVFILLNWLFKDALLFQALSTNLAKIIRRKDDHYITLGWCTLVRGLVDYKATLSLYLNTGIQEKHKTLLQILFASLSHLSSVLCKGREDSNYQPRLAVAAADCILVLTEASTKIPADPEVSNIKTKSSVPDMKQLVALSSTASDEEKGKSSSRLLEKFENMEVDSLLWDHMDELIILVQRLMVWSRKSRPLHAKGLEQVLKWLHEIKERCSSVSVKAGGSILKTGVSLLSSCWKHYSVLLRLEDHKFSQNYLEMLHQYVSGIEFCMNGYSKEHSGIKDGGNETRKFFLITTTLLLGRLDSKQFEIAMSEHGLQISRLLLSRLEYLDEDTVEMAVSILRATIFKTNCSLPDRTPIDTEQMEIVFPLLLNLLDERDAAAKAVVMLTAEYCSLNADGQCLKEILKRLAAQSLLQRRNAIDVISEFLHISNSKNSVSHHMRQAIAPNLLDRLADDEPLVRVQASNQLAAFDPPLVLPELVQLVYSPHERVKTSSSNTLLEVLKRHNKSPDVIIMLINCVSKLCQSHELPDAGGSKVEGKKFDSDELLKLIPQWSKSVEDWSIYIEPLVDKMFAEPSNAVIVRFLSYISESLAEMQDVVLHRVLLYMQGQKEVNNSVELKDNLFSRLCPLLIIRLLPLIVFDDLNSTVMYGQLLKDNALHGSVINPNNEGSIVTILISRALDKSEFEDVRKLAAELSGRVHPQVLFPIIKSQLEHATSSREILIMKACLFALCTSLMLRGSIAAHHPILLEIRLTLETILLWPSQDNDEVSKAQHGCIDCLALTICSQLQTLDSSNNSTLNYVIHNLTQNSNSSLPISFHLCMANILISACQKIPISFNTQLADRILPVLISSLGMIKESEVSAACIQVLFSAVYHLKTAILPYACDLLNISIKALKKGTLREKMASVKLMAALMASEDLVVGSISGGVLEARAAVLSVSLEDSSVELRRVCQQLLGCLSSPLL